MNEFLAARIKQVYPTGLLAEADAFALGAGDQDARIDRAIEKMDTALQLHVHREHWEGQPSYQIALTPQGDPLFKEWYQVMDGPTKLQWLVNHKRPYTILWLQMSRVADHFRFYFNDWVPRDATGYVEIDFKETATGHWLDHQAGLFEVLAEAGFTALPDERMAGPVPFLLEHDDDGTPEDDPRWDDEDWDPPLVPTTLAKCLFGS